MKMNIDFLISDKADTETTKEEILEFRIPSPALHARAGTSQNVEFPGPLISPKQGFNSTQELSLLAQAEAYKGARALTNRFTCQVCSKAYRGKRDLARHMKKHNAPNRFSCSIDGCLQTMYRVDAMQNHIRTHKKRLKTEMERKQNV
jgi:uncharacterized Zn-finger protein